jgi:PAS domain S-box-containing protein
MKKITGRVNSFIELLFHNFIVTYHKTKSVGGDIATTQIQTETQHFKKRIPLWFALRYSLAVLVVAAGWGLRLSLHSWVGSGLPTYITFYPAVILISLLAGFGPGLVATALSACIVGYWVLSPVGQFSIASPVDRLGLALFTAMGLLISIVSEIYHRSRDKAAAYDREIAMHESEERYRVLVENSPDLISRFDRNLRMIYANPTLLQRINKTMHELTGLTAQEYDANSVTAKLWEASACKVLETEQPQRLEVTSEWQGLMRTYDIMLMPEYGTEHTVSSIMTIARDITERKQAEEALYKNVRLLQDVIDGSTNPIFLKDRDGRFITINASLERMLGMSKDEIKGKTDYDIAPKEVADYWKTHDKKVIETGKAFQIEEVADLQDGHHIFLANKFPLLDGDGQIYGVGAISHDITDRKRAEEALKIAYDELELKVQERTTELNKMNDKLLKSNMALNDFAHIASHDLQEPLRKLITFTDLLVSKEIDSLSDQSRDYFERIKQAAERMRSLIEDLVKYSRITSSRRHFKTFNLKLSIEEAVTDLSLRLKETEAEIKIDALPDVNADEIQMGQLFVNLISNSLKYQSNQKPIIKIYSGPSSDKRFNEIHVKDNGIGFDELHLDKIFKPFQRLHGKSSPYQGTGMGLAICSKIVEFHGGSITAKSELGEGSTFIVRLPKVIRKPVIPEESSE